MFKTEVDGERIVADIEARYPDGVGENDPIWFLLVISCDPLRVRDIPLCLVFEWQGICRRSKLPASIWLSSRSCSQ